MNVLVLGGTGFLGWSVAKKLAQNGNNVRAYSPSASRIPFIENITPVTGFIADSGELKKQVDWCDMVFHFVSTTNPKTSLNDPYHDLSSNLLPIIQLLELLKENIQKKIIFCSSGGAVYGKSHGLLIDEGHSKKPSTSYGLVKSTIEEYLNYYHQKYGIQYLILRPANVYGPKLRSIGEQGIISTLIHNSLHNKTTCFWVSPENVRDYIFIDDFVEAVKSLFDADAEGVFNIGSGKGYSLLQIVNAVQQNSNTELLIEYADELIHDEFSNVLSNSKINLVTGWYPQTDLNDGIAAVYEQMTNAYITTELAN